MGQLILLRHGQSAWNLENRFTGWIDVDLSEQGVEEAIKSGQIMAAEGLTPDLVHTSVLDRAIRTAELALREMGRTWLPVQRHWRLNERHYGALQGLNKDEMRKQYSPEQVHLWRRSYDVRPPALDRSDPTHSVHDPRYADVPSELVPDAECLGDVRERMLPYYFDVMVPQLRAGMSLLVSAHGNSIRALMMYLENISEEEIPSLEIPNGVPIVYEVDDKLNATRTHWLG